MANNSIVKEIRLAFFLVESTLKYIFNYYPGHSEATVVHASIKRGRARLDRPRDACREASTSREVLATQPRTPPPRPAAQPHPALPGPERCGAVLWGVAAAAAAAAAALLAGRTSH